MANSNAETHQQTHLGWRSPNAEGQDGQDHLWLQEPWQGSSEETSTEQEPVIQFLDPVLKPKSPNSHSADDDDPEGESSGILFQEVLDGPVESPAFLWSGEDTINSNLAEPIVFGE
ncbi:MAG: hypothetical protein EBZ76_14095, partial [Synechococcaceae bacterium WB9_2_170]|nr:hypothetical protein [Synechococcaceae bacterium WB9_2_170]